MGGHNGLAGLNGLREPYVASYHAVVANINVAAKYCCAGVYNNVVAYVRMALIALYQCAVAPNFKASCAQSYALVKLNMLAYNGGFAYYHARAVVYEEIAAYRFR